MILSKDTKKIHGTGFYLMYNDDEISLEDLIKILQYQCEKI